MALVIDIIAVVFAVIFGILATYYVSLQIWAYHRPNGTTASALRPPIII